MHTRPEVAARLSAPWSQISWQGLLWEPCTLYGCTCEWPHLELLVMHNQMIWISGFACKDMKDIYFSCKLRFWHVLLSMNSRQCHLRLQALTRWGPGLCFLADCPFCIAFLVVSSVNYLVSLRPPRGASYHQRRYPWGGPSCTVYCDQFVKPWTFLAATLSLQCLGSVYGPLQGKPQIARGVQSDVSES